MANGWMEARSIDRDDEGVPNGLLGNDRTPKQVRPYYNPSLGWWLKDLTRVSYMYIRAPTEDPVVTGLAKHLSMVRVRV